MGEIQFHCEHCGKKISAPDASGGRLGKCPYCKQSCYVPMPRDQVDEIPLAAEDPDEEKHRQQLIRETQRLQAQLLDHQEEPPVSGSAGKGGSAGRGAASPVPQPVVSLDDLIGRYISAMVKGQLAAADQFASSIVSQGKKALQRIDDLAMTGLADPELQSVPANVVAGFFRQLRSKFQ